MQFVELFNDTFTLQANSIPPPGSFDVPARASNLTFIITPISTSTCYAASPEIHSNGTITSPMVSFQSPSGNTTQIPYDSPSGCNLQGAPGPLQVKTVPTAADAGAWSFQVRGWGNNFDVNVAVTASIPSR